MQNLSTFKQKHLPYIANSFRYPYKTGRIEGTNHKIKIFSRVVHGYRSFRNYRYRIILHFKLKDVE
ncbi:transposase [Amphibacillus cookii]|uniref:transposase n=1 Tax=Amphibacillus cookii TaxID=767787 RepID=UPI001956CCBA